MPSNEQTKQLEVILSEGSLEKTRTNSLCIPQDLALKKQGYLFVLENRRGTDSDFRIVGTTSDLAVLHGKREIEHRFARAKKMRVAGLAEDMNEIDMFYSVPVLNFPDNSLTEIASEVYSRSCRTGKTRYLIHDGYEDPFLADSNIDNEHKVYFSDLEILDLSKAGHKKSEISKTINTIASRLLALLNQ